MTVSTINYTNQSFDYNSISENCLPFILTCGPICINSVTATISQLLRRLFLFTWSNQLSQRGIFFQLFPGPTRFLTPLYKPLLYLLHSSSQLNSNSDLSITSIFSPIHCIFRFSSIWKWKLWPCFLQLLRFCRRLLPLRNRHWLRHRRRTKAPRFHYRFPVRLSAPRWSSLLLRFSGTR